MAAGVAAAAELRFVVPAVDDASLEVRVEGLSPDELERLADARLVAADWQRILPVVAFDPAGPQASDFPSLLGRYEVFDRAIVFRPRYAPAPGLTVEARLVGRALDRRLGTHGTPDLVARHRVPNARGPQARVVAVDPGPGEVPANLLRVYVHFSHPMSVRGVPEQVRLLREDGRAVELAFVEVDQGLWSPDRRRLTLFLHPGRVKRGVAPHEALGPVLRSGETVRLQVGSGARDASGRALARTHDVVWTVAPPDHDGPRPERWLLTPPAESSGALRVEFGERVDRAIAGLALRIEADGRPVPAAILLDPDGRAATVTVRGGFSASTVWELVVGPELEDPSGNRVGRRFEAPVARSIEVAPVRLPFDAPRPDDAARRRSGAGGARPAAPAERGDPPNEDGAGAVAPAP